MRSEVTPDLWVADERECGPAVAAQRVLGRWPAIVHACKYPCHAAAVGYDGEHATKKITPDHPEYVWAERPGNLFLNMIDPPQPLFRVETFTRAAAFIGQARPGGPTLVHCNQGRSRAPSLVLVFLARAGRLPRDSFGAAREAFVALYPAYEPGLGLVTFLTERWREVL